MTNLRILAAILLLLGSSSAKSEMLAKFDPSNFAYPPKPEQSENEFLTWVDRQQRPVLVEPSERLVKAIVTYFKGAKPGYKTSLALLSPVRKVGVANPKFVVWLVFTREGKITLEGIAKIEIQEGESGSPYEVINFIPKADLKGKLKEDPQYTEKRFNKLAGVMTKKFLVD